MRASTLCFVALACLMAQFTNALPLNSKRNDAAAGNFGNGIESGSGSVVSNESSGAAGVLVGTAATPEHAEAIAAANGGPSGKEIAKTVTKDLNLGIVNAAAGAAVGAAVDPNGKNAAAGGSLAGGVDAAHIVTVTGSISGADALGTGTSGKTAAVAGSVTAPVVGKLSASDAGDLLDVTHADGLNGVGHGGLPGL